MASVNGGQVQVSLTLDDRMTGGLRQADSAMLAFTGSTERALLSLSRLGPAAASITVVGLAAKATVGQFADFEQRIATMNSVLQATPAQTAAVSRGILNLATTTVFSASQITDAATKLAKGGADSATILSQLKPVLDLASASMTNATTAAAGFVTAQKAFGLSTADSVGTANILARAVDSSIGSFENMTTALKQVGPVARAAGLDLQQTTAAIAALQNAGLQGDSGTALKVFMQRLTEPTVAAKQVLNQLGISAFDAAGNMKSLSDIMDQIMLKTASLDDQTKNADLEKIFGTRGARVADIAAVSGSSGISDVMAQEAKLGDASEIAKRKLDTLSGSVKEFQSSANKAAVEIGQGLEPAVRGIVDMAKSGTDITTSILGSGVGSALSSAASGLAVVAALYKGLSIAQEAATVKFGTMDQAIEAGIKPMNDRSAALARFNQLQAQSTFTQSMIAQQEAQLARGPVWTGAGVAVPKGVDEGLLAAEQTQAEQEDLLRKGALSKDVEAYAARRSLYEQDLADHNRLSTAKADWDAAELQRVATQMQQRGQWLLNNLNAGGIPPTVTPARPFGQVVPPLPVEPIIDDVAIKEASGWKSKVSGAVSTAGLTAGRFVMPILVLATIDQLVVEPLEKNIVERIVGDQFKNVQAKIAVDLTVGLTSGLSSRDIKNQLTDVNDELDKATKQLANYKKEFDGKSLSLGPLGHILGADNIGSGGDIITPGETERYKQAQQTYDDALAAQKRLQDQLKNNPQLVSTEENQRVANLADEVKNGNVSIADAITSFDRYTVALDNQTTALIANDEHMRDMGMTQEQITKIDQSATETLVASSKARQQAIQEEQDAQDAITQKYMDNLDLMDKARAAGVTDQQISGGIFGVDEQGNALAKGQQAVFAKAIQIQEAANTKMIDDTKKAWEEALSSLSGVSLTSGVSGLADQATKLSNADNALTAMGQHSETVSGLAKIAEEFKAIYDAEAKASAEFDGILLKFNATGGHIKILDGFKSQVDEAYQYAGEKAARGVATPEDIAILQGHGNIADNIANVNDQLQESKIKDVLDMSKVIPDLVAVNQQITDLINSTDGKTLTMQIEAATVTAQGKIDEFIAQEQDKKITLTVDVTYAYPDGSPAGPPLPPGYNGSSPTTPLDGANPDVPPQGGPPGGGGSAGGSTMTPHGDASVIEGYMPYILKAVADEEKSSGNRIAPELVADIIMHESSGKAGSVNEQSGASGLMQVYYGPGGNTQYAPYANKLRGTSPDDIQFQISAGTHILSNNISQYGPEGGVQHYAGGDYTSDYYGKQPGVQGGLNFPQELAQYYTGPVDNAIAAYAESSRQGQVGGGPNGNGTLSPSGRGGVVTGAEGGGSEGAQVDSVRQKIVNKALQSLNTDTLAGYCEQFVEQTIQAITGQRGSGVKQADGNNPADASQAFQLAKSKGLETNQPQKGDLVYYPDAAGGSGHVAIYMGEGREVSTQDAGFGHVQGNKNLVHTEDVGPGARYIHVPNIPDDLSSALLPGQTGTNQSQVGTNNFNVPNANGSILNKVVWADATQGAKDLNAELAKMDGKTISNLSQGFDKVLSAEQQMSKEHPSQFLRPDQNVGGLDDNALQSNTALMDAAFKNAGAQANEIDALMAKAVNDLLAGGQGAEAVFAQIRQEAGPLGDAFVQMAKNTAEMAQNAAALAALDDKSKQVALDWQKTTDARTVADQAHTYALEDQAHQAQQAKLDEDAANTKEQWGIEDARKAIQDKWKADSEGATAARKNIDDLYRIEQQNNKASTDQENQTFQVQDRVRQDKVTQTNDAWTIESRQLQDKQRYMQQYGNDAKKALQDQMVLLENQYALQTKTNGAQEQLLAAKAKDATSNAGAQTAAEQLAMLNQADKLGQTNLDNAKKANQLALDAEDRLISQQKYDFETLQLQEQRKHEDALNHLQVEETAAQRAHQDVLDRLKNDSDAATLAHDNKTHQMDEDAAQAQLLHDHQMAYWATEDTDRSRAHTLTQQQEAQDALNRQEDETTYQRGIKATRDAQDVAHQAEMDGIQKDKDALNERNKQLSDQNAAMDTIIGNWAKVATSAGQTADVLLAALGPYITQSNATPSPHARGGLLGGYSLVGEDGPELVKGGGVADSAADTANILRQAVGMSSGPAPIYNAGDRHYHIYQQPGESNEDLVARIEAMEERERERVAAERLPQWQGGRR